jgi:hypothetical protein
VMRPFLARLPCIRAVSPLVTLEDILGTKRQPMPLPRRAGVASRAFPDTLVLPPPPRSRSLLAHIKKTWLACHPSSAS